MLKNSIIILVIALCSLQCFAANDGLRVTAENTLNIPRASETITLQFKELQKHLKSPAAERIVVREHPSGERIASQVIDIDLDGTADELIFQADFKAKESKDFSVEVSEDPLRKAFKSKVFGRFVPERKDDFAWENDRIAFRMYGPELQRTKVHGLTSSGIDVWCKRVDYLIIDKWYKMGDDYYHEDRGEGADFYSTGPGRGCGGTGIWQDGKLYVSENYVSWKVIANGPVRTIFELTYKPWDVEGQKISEVKRIILDAGQNLNRFESTFNTSDKEKEITFAVGIAKHEETAIVSLNKKAGISRVWEPMKKGAGSLGCGVVVEPTKVVDIVEADEQVFLIAKATPGKSAAYYAGAGWSKSGDFTNVLDWDDYLKQFAQRLQSPLKITLISQN